MAAAKKSNHICANRCVFVIGILAFIAASTAQTAEPKRKRTHAPAAEPRLPKHEERSPVSRIFLGDDPGEETVQGVPPKSPSLNQRPT